jgi:4-hydroxy-tetrahydrodipicolinate reductase
VSEVTRVGVVGAGGRMGKEVCRAVLGRPGFELVAAVDPNYTGTTVSSLVGAEAGGPTLTIAADASALAEAGTEVVVDFTRIEAARHTLAVCAAAGIHAVVGTTGVTRRDLDDWSRLFAGPSATAPNCVVAANFAIGAVLLMRFCELAAPHFDSVEIIELHHDGKVDAPSGTSLRTAERIAEGRAAAGTAALPGDRTTTTVVEGVRGGEGAGGVRIHSLRLPGLVAHQEVVFGSTGQTLTIRHDTTDRVSFMDGVLLAIDAVPDRPGLTVGLEPLLGL